MSKVICPTCGGELPSTMAVCPRDGTPLARTETRVGLGDTPPPTPSHPAAFEAGTTLGSYRVLGLLGEGGMGQVYLAEHVKLQRRVALKLLRDRWTQDTDVLRRFFFEAQSVNRVRHPNIIEITDLVEEGGLAYYIMELLEGLTLGQRLQTRPLSVGELLRVGIAVADALAAAHLAGIIHRDLKPDNIFLVGGGVEQIKLLDFGLAKLRQGIAGELKGTTNPEVVLGTPEYMAPEQVRGRADLDGKADVYSLGTVLYLLLCGQRPIVSPSLGELLVQVVITKPTPPSQIPELGRQISPRLDRLIMRCLEKEPAQRQTAREVADELRAIELELGDAGRAAVPASTPTLPPPGAPAAAATEPEPARPPLPRSSQARSWRWVAVGAGALALTALAFGIALRKPAPSSPPAGSATAPTERPGEPIAKLTQLWGEVGHRKREGGGWDRAERGLALHFHDRIRTGRGARSRVVFDAGGRLDLDELSEVLVEPPAGGGPAARLVSGTVRAVAAPGKPFTFVAHDGKRTRILAGGSKEASLRIRSREGGRTEVALLEGEAQVSGGGRSVTLTAKQVVDLSSGAPGAPARMLAFPNLISPSVDAVVVAQAVPFRWTSIQDAARYRVQVSHSTSFDENLLDTVVAGPETRLSGVKPDLYVWRVSSIDRDGHEGEFGFARRFTLQARPTHGEPRTVMIAPAHGAVIEHLKQPQPTSFRWQGEAEGRYLLVIGKTASLKQPLHQRRVLGPKATHGPLPPGTYYWGVYLLEARGHRRLFRDPSRFTVTQWDAPKVQLPPIEWK